MWPGGTPRRTYKGRIIRGDTALNIDPHTAPKIDRDLCEGVVPAVGLCGHEPTEHVARLFLCREGERRLARQHLAAHADRGVGADLLRY